MVDRSDSFIFLTYCIPFWATTLPNTFWKGCQFVAPATPATGRRAGTRTESRCSIQVAACLGLLNSMIFLFSSKEHTADAQGKGTYHVNSTYVAGRKKMCITISPKGLIELSTILIFRGDTCVHRTYSHIFRSKAARIATCKGH